MPRVMKKVTAVPVSMDVELINGCSPEQSSNPSGGYFEAHAAEHSLDIPASRRSLNEYATSKHVPHHHSLLSIVGRSAFANKLLHPAR